MAPAVSSATERVRAATFYRPELDAVRFFAFLAVYLHHSFSSLVAGAFGVDLFLVLSAYLITELLQLEVNRTGGLDVRRFYARRILRIWPLYFAFLGISYLATKHVIPGDFLP